VKHLAHGGPEGIVLFPDVAVLIDASASRAET